MWLPESQFKSSIISSPKTSFNISSLIISPINLSVSELGKHTSYEEVMNTLKSASGNELNGILGYTDEAVVSQDFIGDARTSIVDAKGGIQLNSKFYKIISWYDNEAGYSNKLIDLAKYFCL